MPKNKISVWMTNTVPGTELQIDLIGTVNNKTVIEVDFPLFESIKNPDTGEISRRETNMLVIGTPIPKGQEWNPAVEVLEVEDKGDN